MSKVFEETKKEKGTLHIDKGVNEYIGYITGEKNACAIHYLPSARVAYVHNTPPEASGMCLASGIFNLPIVEEKIFLAVETVNGEYCIDDSGYKGKKPTNADGEPLKGQYLVESWLIDENGEQFGDPVEVGAIELEVDDQSGENYKKIIEYIAGYVKFHDFWVIYQEREEAMAEFMKYKKEIGW